MDSSNGAQAGREGRDDNSRWQSLIWLIRNRKHPFWNSQILCRIMLTYLELQDHNDFRPGCSSGKESAWKFRRHKRLGFDPLVGKIPRVGNGNPLQYSCLDNPMDRGAWQATVWGGGGVSHGIDPNWATENIHTQRSMRRELGKAVRRLLQ